MQYCLLQALFLLNILVIASPELYTSVAELEGLLHTGGVISETLKIYLDKEEQRLKHIKWLSTEYEKLYKAASEDVQRFVSNPVQAYLLVKRLTADWEKTELLIYDSDSKDFLAHLTQGSLKFPDLEDLNGAATALMRLQDTYLLEASTLAKGEIKGTNKTFSQLSAGDCFELGYQACSNDDFSHALTWFKEALQRLEQEEEIKTVDKNILLEHLAYNSFMIEDVKNAINYTKRLLELDADFIEAQNNLRSYEYSLSEKEALKKEDSTNETINSEIETDVELVADKYRKLCRGEKMKSDVEQSKLFCRYVTKNNSYLMLQPVKEEILSLNPMIVMYYDVISDSTVEALKNVAMPKLSRAMVENDYTFEPEKSNARISKCTWLNEGEHDAVTRSNRMVEDITGLETDTAEPLHIINYGIGGHYDPHYDFRGEGEDLNAIGGRIATWIYYLSDVDAGGATVFPEAGVSLKPKKGGAAFWYNLMKSGDLDPNSLHAGCPVLAGSKWIANKWLHERHQEFRRPCSLNSLE